MCYLYPLFFRLCVCNNNSYSLILVIVSIAWVNSCCVAIRQCHVSIHIVWFILTFPWCRVIAEASQLAGYTRERLERRTQQLKLFFARHGTAGGITKEEITVSCADVRIFHICLGYDSLCVCCTCTCKGMRPCERMHHVYQMSDFLLVIKLTWNTYITCIHTYVRTYRMEAGVSAVYLHHCADALFADCTDSNHCLHFRHSDSLSVVW